jgi:hypothetical protein
MRLRFALLGSALVIAGCGGGGASACTGGDQVCPVLVTSISLRPADSWQTPAAPVPVGSSVDVAFVEQSCSSSSNNRRPLPGSGCTAWYPAPASRLVVTTLPLPDGSPCPIASAVVGAGTLRFTRTGPGDPRLRAGNAGLPGYCGVQVHDPGIDETVVVL